MVAAEALDREHAPGAQQGGRLGDRVAGDAAAGGVDQPQPRAAVGAARRLGVEAAVGRVVVLRRAGRAHGEPGHGGERPVVGHPPDDGEAWPAVRAVGERIAEAPGGGIADLGPALVAGGHVGGHERHVFATVAALDDNEARFPQGGHPVAGQRLDDGQRRRLGVEGVEEGGQCGFVVPLGLDEHPFGVVADQAAQLVAGGEGVDEGPEADALDDARHPDPEPHPPRSLRGHPGSGGRLRMHGQPPTADCTRLHSTW